jgi:hypothetical protein
MAKKKSGGKKKLPPELKANMEKAKRGEITGFPKPKKSKGKSQ